jgi:hypothetical protein
LPSWIKIWTGLELNVFWDCCWLTLLCRARKHTKTFDWQSLFPLLLLKSKELMHLPDLDSGKPPFEFPAYPHAAPPQYSALLAVRDTRNVALTKIAKLIYYLVIQCTDTSLPEMINVTPQAKMTVAVGNEENSPFSFGPHSNEKVSKLSVELVLYFQSLRPFFYPANTGKWTPHLAYFITTTVFQVCRHVGASVRRTLLGPDPFLPASAQYSALNNCVDAATTKYLCSSLLPLVIEGVYCKDLYMGQFSMSCLKNLVGIDLSLGDLVVPYLLSALDPAAVNQSHQAPIAMNVLSLSFKALIFPQPVITKYLPSLLKLSLPGVDASDPKKTIITLSMYSTIFSWLSLRSSYTAWSPVDVPPAYVALLPGFGSKGPSFSQAVLQDELDALSAYLAEWLPAFIDKVIMILEAQEENQKGVKASPVGSHVVEVFTYMFQGLALDEPLRAVAEDKITGYFLRSTPTNAGKISAGIVDTMISTNPKKLHSFLAAILASEVTSASYDANKLAFRIRLASGACRAAQGLYVFESIDILKSVLESAALVNHSNKMVKKATGKLLKDIFKGATAIYPINISPVIVGSNCVAVSGYLTPGTLSWHLPSSDTLTKTADLLRLTVSKAIENAKAILREILAGAVVSTVPAANEADGNMSPRKSEDYVVTCLHIISNAIRGTAETLGDDNSAASLGKSEGTKSGPLLHTARDQLLLGLSEADQTYYKELRSNVLAFLSYCHESLQAVPSSSPYASLKDSSDIIKKWNRVFSITSTQRMTCLKHIEKYKHYFMLRKRFDRSPVAKSMYKAIKKREIRGVTVRISTAEHGLLTDEWATKFACKDFWKGHDSSNQNIANNAWLQHAQRQKQLAVTTFHANVHADDKADPYMKCLHQLQSHCEHEYDGVRLKSYKVFEKVTPYFIHKLLDVTKGLITSLTAPDGVTYPKVVAAVTLINQTRIMHKIVTHYELTDLFLNTILQCQAAIVLSIREQDKREILISKLTKTFIKYISMFHHDYRLSKSALLATINASLANSGHGEQAVQVVASVLTVETTRAVARVAEGGNLEELMATIDMAEFGVAVAPTGGAGVATQASGLRFQTLSAVITTHYIGHMGLVLNASVWKWSLTTICEAHGNPIQSIALAALVRLSFQAQTKGVPSDLRQTLGASLFVDSPTTIWPSLLKGMSQCHPKASEDGSAAQWSAGIDQLLRVSEFLKAVQPRSVTCVKTTTNEYSFNFRKADAGAFLSLALAGLLFAGDAKLGDTIGAFNCAALQVFLDSARELTDTSESERQSNNAVKAELFAGLQRAYNISCVTSSGRVSASINDRTSTSSRSQRNGVAALLMGSEDPQEVQQVFLKFFVENIDSISSRYNGEWAEAVQFGFTGEPIVITDAIPKCLLTVFSQIIDGHNSGDSNEEGFARQGKYLALVGALLVTDVTNCVKSGVATSAVAEQLLLVLNDPSSNVISPHLDCRKLLAGIFQTLVEAYSGSKDLSVLRSKLMAAASKRAEAVDEVGAEMDVVVGGGDTPPPPILSSSSSSSSATAAHIQSKNALQTSSWWLQYLLYRSSYRSQKELLGLLPITLLGAGHADIEVAKLCHQTCLNASSSLHSSDVCSGHVEDDLLASLALKVIKDFTSHASRHIRETVMICTSVIMINNWSALSVSAQKACKDVFVGGLNDVKPEVRKLAQAGLISYLALKPARELQTIAEAYTKNSDAYAEREKRKRKLAKDGAVGGATVVEKPDTQYSTTILMMSCVILTTPYDLPSYLPNLLVSFMRHVTTSSAMKDTITKTMQLFKVTHQDRWESEFKDKFTRNQLEDLQGAGAAHYFS